MEGEIYEDDHRPDGEKVLDHGDELHDGGGEEDGEQDDALD